MLVPMIGSPPIPMQVVCPKPASVMAFTISYVNVPLREITPASPSLKSWFGMIPIFAWPGDASPGQLGPMTTQPRLRSYGMRSRQSWNGTRSVMMTTSLIPPSIASIAASFAYGAGTKMMEAFARLRCTASRTLSKTGTPSTFVPPLPGVTPATTFVPKSIIARVWNCPWWPVIPWTRTRLFFVRRTDSLCAPRFDFDRELGGFLHGLRGIRADGAEHLLRLGFVHPFDPCDDGDLRVHLLERLLHSERHGIRFRDPAEDVQQDDGGVRLNQELECLLDSRRVVRPAEVQERPTLSAFQAQDVQGGHREPRAVRDDADVPLELDERDPLVVGLLLEGGPVLVQVRVFRMTILRVVVDDELGVSRDHAALFRDDERIDLDEFRILLPEQVIGVPDDGCELVSDLLGKRELLHEASEDVRLDPDDGRDVLHVDLVARDRLDVDPALRARHEKRLSGRSIDGEAEVELPSDVQPLLEVHLFHAIPVDVHAEDLPGDRAGFVERLRGLDSAGLSASADEDLCLDHAGEGRIADVVRSRCDGPPRNGDAIAGEDLLRLVFEELHADRSRRWVDGLYLL